MKGTENLLKKRARPASSPGDNQRKVMNGTKSSAEDIHKSYVPCYMIDMVYS